MPYLHEQGFTTWTLWALLSAFLLLPPRGIADAALQLLSRAYVLPWQPQHKCRPPRHRRWGLWAWPKHQKRSDCLLAAITMVGRVSFLTALTFRSVRVELLVFFIVVLRSFIAVAATVRAQAP